jgi:hypothetical protein
MAALYALWYNFVRIHKTLRTSPAMAAGIEKRLWSMEDVDDDRVMVVHPDRPPKVVYPDGRVEEIAPTPISLS